MNPASTGYWGSLAEDFGRAWNRFWFSPSDPFPLGCIRVVAGLLLLYVQLAWTYDLSRVFADGGLLTVETNQKLLRLQGRVEANQQVPFSPSILNFTQSSTSLMAVHALGLLAVVLFTVGWKTRITSVLTLLAWLSYYHRAPVLAGEMEPVLSMILFYLCLAPSGESLSVDRWLVVRKAREVLRLQNRPNDPVPPPEPSWQATIPLRLMQIHLTLIFAMMALAKLSGPNPPAVWWTGDGIWWLMAKVETRPFDMTGIASVGESRLIVDAMCHAVVWFELLFPLFVWNERARPLMLGLLAILWGLLIGAATGLFVFVLAVWAASLAFWRPETLRALTGRILPCDCAA